MLPNWPAVIMPGNVAERGPSTWALATLVGDPKGVIGPWPQSVPALAFVDIGGVNPSRDAKPFPFSPPPPPST